MVVQVVQHDEEGRLVKIGVPMDLLAYQPQEGAVRNMLAEWVNKRHSRDDAPSEVRARQDWRWLYLHTCGTARKHLEEAERQEHPFNRALKKTVKVDIESVTKTVTPEIEQRVRDMRAEGASLRAIAGAVGYSTATVQGVLKGSR